MMGCAPNVVWRREKAAKLLTKDEARRIAVNIAKVPEISALNATVASCSRTSNSR
jgi:hypothetical protein